MIAAVGNVSRDIVDGAPPRPGGTVFYSARVLAHLRIAAHIGASCAAADRQDLVQPLEALGLSVTWFESAQTTAYRFHYEADGHRAMLQDAVGDPWPPDHALEAVADADWVHVGALVRTDFPPTTLEALAADGRRLLVDGQGLVRTPALGRLRTNREIGDVLRHVTILKLDGDEAETLVGTRDPEPLRSLGVPEVLVTYGAQGSAVVTGAAVERVEAHGLPARVDPTGAGDMFSSGYLVARAAGAEPLEAARAATAVVVGRLADR